MSAKIMVGLLSVPCVLRFFQYWYRYQKSLNYSLDAGLGILIQYQIIYLLEMGSGYFLAASTIGLLLLNI